MKVLVSYARNLGHKTAARRRRLSKLAAKMKPKRQESQPTAEIASDPPPYHECIREDAIDVKEAAEEPASPDLLVEKALVFHSEDKKSEYVQTTKELTEMQPETKMQPEPKVPERGRTKEILYRSQMNDAMERSRMGLLAVPALRYKPVRKPKWDTAHLPSIRRCQMYVEDVADMFQVVQVCLCALLAWLVLYNVVPPMV